MSRPLSPCELTGGFLPAAPPSPEGGGLPEVLAKYGLPEDAARNAYYKGFDRGFEVGCSAAPAVPGGGLDREALATAVVDRADDEKHADLCTCAEWPLACLSGYARRQFTHDPEAVARRALAWDAGS